MTRNEGATLEAVQDNIDRERARADCPCVRALLVILSNGVTNLAEAGAQARKAA